MRKTSYPVRVLVFVSFVLSLALAACGAPAEPATPTPTPTSAPAPATAVSAVDAGKVLLTEKGCAACHGANGEGMENLGPALPGHSREAVFRQVREPRPVPEGSVQMPAFSQEQISDEELEQIVAFIESLGPPMGAGPFAGSMTEAAHLRLALVSLEADSVDDARVHLQELLVSAEGETREKAKAILALLDEGDLHEAEHELETMLAEAEGDELTPMQLHIILALDALQKHADDDAIMHLENAIGVAEGDAKAQLEQLLADLNAGEAHDVEHELEELLGLESHSE